VSPRESPDPGPVDPPPRRRPRDRRDHVARHARTLFAERGFHAVRMEDIASAVGVTARALYRHFPNKHALLAHVAVSSQDAYFAALQLHASSDAGLRDLAGGLVRLSLDDPSHALLWQREARHLGEAERRTVQQRVVEIARGVETAVASVRGDRRSAETEILAWAALAVATSRGHSPVTEARARHDDELLTAALLAVARTPDLAPGAPDPRPYEREPVLTSRRERLLHHAAALFRRHGYLGVTLEDIGERAGIHGPSIYHHFPSKLTILQALISRLDEWITLGLLDAHGRGADPRHVLDLFGEFYVGLALRFPDLVSVALTESIHLSDPERDGRSHDVLLTGWTAMLQAARPDLEQGAASALARAARATVDDLVRIPHLRRERLGGLLVAVTRATLAAVVERSAAVAGTGKGD
jgi:AcrR family transcriptional regulator